MSVHSSFNTLSQILDRQFSELDTARLDQVRTAWREICAPEWVNHTEIIAFKGSILTVYADSPLWGNALIHQKASLQRRLVDHGLDVRELRIRVIPQNTKRSEENKPRQKREIPPEAIKILRETAQNAQHESLKSSLQRLSEHKNPRSVEKLPD